MILHRGLYLKQANGSLGHIVDLNHAAAVLGPFFGNCYRCTCTQVILNLLSHIEGHIIAAVACNHTQLSRGSHTVMDFHVQLFHPSADRGCNMAEFHLVVITDLGSLILEALCLSRCLISLKLLVRYKTGGMKGRHTV